jgi:hypothetical protein
VNAFPKPTVTFLERTDPLNVNLGDSATVTWDPALLRHLLDGDPPGATGLHALSQLPLGLMTEAALLAAGRDETGIDTLLYARVNYRNPVPAEGTWEAYSTVRRVFLHHVEASAVLTAPGGEPVYSEAVLGLARIDHGHATATLLTGQTLATTDY